MARPEDSMLIDFMLDRELTGLPVEMVDSGDTRQDSEVDPRTHT